VVRGADGRDTWLVNGSDFFSLGGASSAVRRDGSKQRLNEFDIRMGLQQDEVHLGSYEVEARLSLMDEMNIWAQIVYPNVTGFGANKLMQLDGELGRIIVSTYNDAMAEFQASSRDRLFPQALVPFWDIDLAVTEARRIKSDLKLRGITMCSEPHAAGLPDLLDPHWYPLWEVCSDFNIPINFHVGATDFGMDAFFKGVWPSHDAQHKILVGASILEIHNSRIMANLLASDLLDRFPKTKWISVESGIGWIPFILERLEYQIRDFELEGRTNQTRPHDLFRRQMYACFWFEEAGPSLQLDYIGFDNVMFESDFPHPTCLYPSPVEHGLKVLEHWGPEVQRKVMSTNAATLYDIPL
jgi:predicted TIM-barrel fold metal-dependent hydrolase